MYIYLLLAAPTNTDHHVLTYAQFLLEFLFNLLLVEFGIFALKVEVIFELEWCVLSTTPCARCTPATAGRTSTASPAPWREASCWTGINCYLGQTQQHLFPNYICQSDRDDDDDQGVRGC